MRVQLTPVDIYSLYDFLFAHAQHICLVASRQKETMMEYRTDYFTVERRLQQLLGQLDMLKECAPSFNHVDRLTQFQNAVRSFCFTELLKHRQKFDSLNIQSESGAFTYSAIRTRSQHEKN